MSKSSCKLVLLTSVIIFWNIIVTSSEPTNGKLNNEFNSIQEKNNCFQPQHFDLLNVLKEQNDFILQKLNKITSGTQTQSFSKEQTAYVDILNEITLQRNKLERIEEQIKKVIDDVLELKKHNHISKSSLNLTKNIALSNCAETKSYAQKSGIYFIKVPKISSKLVEVFCNNDIDFGGWTVILSRVDGSIDFNRNWTEYKTGFGDLRGEFFIGLERLHILTSSEAKQELYIAMESIDGEKKYAKYGAFVIGGEDEAYSIKELGNFEGNTNDAFRYHEHTKFSTQDRDNDNTEINCGKIMNAGWWFNDCYDVLFTGPYVPNANYQTNITWKKFIGTTDKIKLKFVQMMIRPANFGKLEF